MLTDLAWLLGVLTLGLISPGPDFFLILRNSLAGSRTLAFGTVGGIAAGLSAQGAVLVFGFGTAPASVVRLVQIAGAIFLVYLGIRSLAAASSTATAAPATAPTQRVEKARAGFVAGLICNLTNPKAFFFFASVYAQMTRPGQPSFWRLALPAIVVVHAIVCWTLIAFALQSPPIASRLQHAQGPLARVFGVALLALGTWIGWTAWRS